MRLWLKGLLWVVWSSDHSNFLHISDKAISLSCHPCVHWSSTFNFLQELFLCIHNLAVSCKRPSLQPVSAFDMPSSLSLIIYSFLFKMRNLKWESFSWTHKGHWRVINWSNFNTVVSQRIRKPEETERSGEQLEQSEDTFINCLLAYVDMVCGAPKPLQQ